MTKQRLIYKRFEESNNRSAAFVPTNAMSTFDANFIDQFMLVVVKYIPPNLVVNHRQHQFFYIRLFFGGSSLYLSPKIILRPTHVFFPWPRSHTDFTIVSFSATFHQSLSQRRNCSLVAISQKREKRGSWLKKLLNSWPVFHPCKNPHRAHCWKRSGKGVE